MKNIFTLIIMLFIIASCTSKKYKLLDASKFKTKYHGKTIVLNTLTNSKGSAVQLTNYGARIVSIWMPDKNKHFADVNLGFATAEDYINAHAPFYGSTIGRFANRISNGMFTIDSVNYQLPTNSGVNTLHGGANGFYKQVWDVFSVNTHSVVYTYMSPDGDQGFPGNLKVFVKFELSENNKLTISYSAKTDKATYINLSNHAFINLGGEASGSITKDVLYVNADYYTPLDSVQIPTGKLASVTNTPYDFRKATSIEARINDDFDQLLMGKGYDMNLVLNKGDEKMIHAATLSDPVSGRTMDVYTTEPGVQLFTGNFLNGSDIGKFGKPLKWREGVCLETQHYPDSPNHVNFPSTLLLPGETFTSQTIYKFGVTK